METYPVECPDGGELLVEFSDSWLTICSHFQPFLRLLRISSRIQKTPRLLRGFRFCSAESARFELARPL